MSAHLAPMEGSFFGSLGRASASSTSAPAKSHRAAFPGSPGTGKDAACDFYQLLTANFRTEEEVPLNRFFDGDTMILEQNMTGTVIGEMLDIPGNGRRVTFRLLHVFGFRDALISREQIWIDTGAIVAQLTSP